MGRLFGTDGIRGIANKDLTCELATQLGRAAAKVLTNKSTGTPGAHRQGHPPLLRHAGDRWRPPGCAALAPVW